MKPRYVEGLLWAMLLLTIAVATFAFAFYVSAGRHV